LLARKFGTALVVIGMHRSGTSALTRVLSLCGLATPRALISPARDNPQGFWESRLIKTLDEDALRELGQSWWTIEPISNESLEQRRFDRHRALAGRILNDEFRDGVDIVLKDPRLCRLLPLWQPILAERCAHVAYAMIMRDPLEVAESLRRRNGLDHQYGLLLWTRYVLDAERHSRGHPRTYISFAALLQDWRSTVKRLEEVSRLPLQRLADAAGIEAFLSAELRNHVVQKDDVAGALPLVGKVHSVLAGWAAGNAEMKKDYRTLDSVVSQLDEFSRFVPAPPANRRLKGSMGTSAASNSPNVAAGSMAGTTYSHRQSAL
jgi:hypothetical protein